MSDLIKSFRLQREELDSDILSDYTFLLGDFNYRMNNHTFDTLIN